MCVEFIGHAPEDMYPGYSSVEKEIDEQEVMQNFNPYICFGTVMKAMLTLFNVAVLNEWTDIVRPVMLKQPHMVLFFLVFCTFVCFGVMNVIIGMIVDSVMQNTRQMEQELEQAKKKDRMKSLQEVQNMIFSVDKDQDELVDFDELQQMLTGSDDKMRRLLAKISLPYGCTPWEFFSMLDNDGDGQLQHDEFLISLYRLMNCSEFQQTCMIQMGINETKKMIVDLNLNLIEIKGTLMQPRQAATEPESHAEQPEKKCTQSELKKRSPVEGLRQESSGVAETTIRTDVKRSSSSSHNEIFAALEKISAGIEEAVRCKLHEELAGLLQEKWSRDSPMSCQVSTDGIQAWEPVKDNAVRIQCHDNSHMLDLMDAASEDSIVVGEVTDGGVQQQSPGREDCASVVEIYGQDASTDSHSRSSKPPSSHPPLLPGIIPLRTEGAPS
jgi:hypothetical protein